jgi:hypothetical protein
MNPGVMFIASLMLILWLGLGLAIAMLFVINIFVGLAIALGSVIVAAFILYKIGNSG